MKWILDSKLKNFAEGSIIDIGNVYFYRLRFMNLKTKLEYEVFTMIHKYNFRITILKEISLNESSPTLLATARNTQGLTLLGSTSQSAQSIQNFQTNTQNTQTSSTDTELKTVKQ